MRQWLFSIVILFGTPQAIAQKFTKGTCVIAIKGCDYVTVGVDSRVTIEGLSHPDHFTGCKIDSNRNIYFIIAGYVDSEMYRITHSNCGVNAKMKTIINICNKKLKPHLEQSLEKWRVDPSALGYNNFYQKQTNMVSAVIFWGIENHKSAVMELFYKFRNKINEPVKLDTVVNIYTACPDNSNNFFYIPLAGTTEIEKLGNAYILNYISNSPSDKDAIINLIKMEALTDTYVGEPIDVLFLKDGQPSQLLTPQRRCSQLIK